MKLENEKTSTAQKNLQYYVSGKCVDGSSIRISKMYPSYPKKTFLNIDGECLINVDDISYVGIEKGTTLGSCEELAKITDPNERIRTKTVYTVKIRSSSGFILWSSDPGNEKEITDLFHTIHKTLKNYGLF